MAGDCEITLIAVNDPAEGETNGHGFYKPPQEGSESKTTVFCKKKSVGSSEFYRAMQAGYKAEMKIDVFKEEYDGQGFAEIGEPPRRFKVLRTFEDPNKQDVIELTLGDLSTRNDEETDEYPYSEDG